MFRRLYWIAEQVNDDGSSRVTGVYSSIQDLSRLGFKWSEESSGRTFRITLVQPDKFDSHLGQWESPRYGNLAHDIRAFVDSKEYSEEEIAMLMGALHGFTG